MRLGHVYELHVATAVFLSFGSFAGCSTQTPASKEAVVPAAGVIQFKGQPLDYFQVTLYPTDGRRPAAGTTDASGKFTLGTNAKDDGAPPGTHKLVVTYSGPPVQQESGKEEAYTPPPPKIKLPAKYGSQEASDATLTIPDSGSRDLKVELQ